MQIGSSTPKLFIISSGKGGVGKTTLTCAIADCLALDYKPSRLIQVDNQNRLTQLYGDLVTTIRAISDTRTDHNALIRSFDPLFSALETAACAASSITIVDVGATQQHTLLRYAALIDLQEELDELGLSTTWLAPATAEPESMAQAARTLASVREALPGVRRRVVLNQRDGAFSFYPKSPAEKIWNDDLLPHCNETGAFTMPKIEAGSWLKFESAGLKFSDVIAASIQSIQDWTGVSRPESKVLRGDIAAWMADMVDVTNELFVTSDSEVDNVKS